MNNLDNKFYCYSLNLMGWLIANNERVVKQVLHSNGNNIWIFERSDSLNAYLSEWNEFKSRKGDINNG